MRQRPTPAEQVWDAATEAMERARARGWISVPEQLARSEFTRTDNAIPASDEVPWRTEGKS
jgi:hypothetical protein